MGQAKRRGTFEQRLAQALERDKAKYTFLKEAVDCKQPPIEKVVRMHSPREATMLMASITALSFMGGWRR